MGGASFFLCALYQIVFESLLLWFRLGSSHQGVLQNFGKVNPFLFSIGI